MLVGHGLSINWMVFHLSDYDGYGRYGLRMCEALRRAGVTVKPIFNLISDAPAWVQESQGADWNNLTISCLPAYFAVPVPGRQWLYSMTEGSELPEKWAGYIRQARVERVIVPCEYNRKGFFDGIRAEGQELPVDVVNGGTDPLEFQDVAQRRNGNKRPYSFLAFGDRGARKGWPEVWSAFYKAFGSAKDTPNVRLIIKSRLRANEMLDMIAEADNPDPRIEIWREDVEHMSTVFERADCVVLPSRSEGFGMPHREAAMAGLPVITQQYAGLDDGYIDEWSIPVRKGKVEKIPTNFNHIQGEWRRADVDELADSMTELHEFPWAGASAGRYASEWLAANQTWDHAAANLIDLIRAEG